MRNKAGENIVLRFVHDHYIFGTVSIIHLIQPHFFQEVFRRVQEFPFPLIVRDNPLQFPVERRGLQNLAFEKVLRLNQR